MITPKRMRDEGVSLRDISKKVFARKKIDDPDAELKGSILQLNASIWEATAELSERLEAVVQALLKGQSNA